MSHNEVTLRQTKELKSMTHTLTRLARFALNDTTPSETIEPTTAIGRRLLDISAGYDDGSLTDQQAEFYLNELAQVCERELRSAPESLAPFLVSHLELLEQFESKSHAELAGEASRLEWTLTRLAVSLTSEVAA
jgi:hypothetical protein